MFLGWVGVFGGALFVSWRAGHRDLDSFVYGFSVGRGGRRSIMMRGGVWGVVRTVFLGGMGPGGGGLFCMCGVGGLSACVPC